MTEVLEREAQRLLDNPSLAVGDRIPCVNAVIGNGSVDAPLLSEVGIDRLGRLWTRDGGEYIMVADFSGSYPPPSKD